ncbi:MAG TPA: hypothetical protein VMC83_13315 [Streptosporangiaceae bacterium]|nr:hypothetical protein [Streptosporangiaceae bacterium]
MAYSQTDPRSRLAPASAPLSPAAGAAGYGTPSYAKFYETEPQLRGGGAPTWVARGQNFVLAYSHVSPGATLERPASQDEYALLIPDAGVSVEVTWGDERTMIPGRTVAFIPPGASAVRALSGGRLIRVLTSAATDLADASSNAGSYATPQPNVAPLDPWPSPAGGYRLRSYSLDVTPEPGRFGRIWRCTTLMVNYTEPRPGPRDVTKMSPHVHDDFEQASLVLDGSFVHHIRWPWGTDMRHWRPDEHEICAGPSLTVIPPLTVHTSQQVGTGINQLVDIFAPPRKDFSAMDGWVLNASDYPMPTTQQREAS